MAPGLSASRPPLDLAWVAAILANWLVVTGAFFYALRSGNWTSYLLAVFIVGTRQHALAVLGHHAAHYHVSRNKRLNDWLANLFAAWPIGYSLSGYRRLHFEHHRTVGTVADPEMMMFRKFARKWSADADTFKLFVTDLLGCGTHELLVLWYDLMRWQPLTPVSRRVEEYLGLLLWRVGAVVVIALTCGWWASVTVVLLWYGALVTAFFAAYRLRCFYARVASAERYCGREPALWQRLLYLPANSWLLWEHYTWPGVPLRQLKLRAAAALRPISAGAHVATRLGPAAEDGI
jgi:fatty acid desaturase